MNCRYFWKELTNDGLLKEPEDVGNYYDSAPVNPHEGYVSELEAEIAYSKLHEEYEWSCPRELVLIKVYSTYRFD